MTTALPLQRLIAARPPAAVSPRCSLCPDRALTREGRGYPLQVLGVFTGSFKESVNLHALSLPTVAVENILGGTLKISNAPTIELGRSLPGTV